MGTSDADAIIKHWIRELGPWHHDIEVVPGIRTSITKNIKYDDTPSMMDPVEHLEAKLRRVFPKGLEGRSFLDCACNCGGHVFAAKKFGAGRCYGFDVRERWIDQARFLLEHLGPYDDVEFEVCDLYDIPQKNLEPFDVTLFQGIFYHLPDPMRGLKIAADLTREAIIVNTATKNRVPSNHLVVGQESTDLMMSGVYGLHWLPGGPEVLEPILAWAGFPRMEVLWWKKKAEFQPRDLGRLEVVAYR